MPKVRARKKKIGLSQAAKLVQTPIETIPQQDQPAPENVEVNIDINADDLVISKADSKEDKDRDDMIDKLIDSILNLTKTIEVQTTKEEKAAPVVKPNSVQPPQSSPKEPLEKETFTGLVGQLLKDKVEDTKEALSLRNMLSTVGLRSAQRGSGSLLDTMLTFREVKQQEKKEEAKKSPRSFTSSAVLGTVDYLKQKTAASNEAGMLKMIRDSVPGKVVSQTIDVTRKSVDETKKLVNKVADRPVFHPIRTIDRSLQKSAEESPSSLFGMIAKRRMEQQPTPEVIPEPVQEKKSKKKSTLPKGPAKEKAPEPEKPPIFWNIPAINGEEDLVAMSDYIHRPTTDPIQQEFKEGLREGMRDELLTLNQEQLEELKKLVDAATVDQETKLEEASKNKLNSPKQIKEAEKSEKKSLLDTLQKGLGGSLAGLKDMIGKAIPLLGVAAKAALPAAAVGGAGIAGYWLGEKLNENVINPYMEKRTGVKGATLGTALYGDVDKIKGLFGASDEDKMKAEDEKQRLILGKRLLGEGKQISDSMAQFLKSKGVTVPASAITSAQAIKPQGYRERQLQDIVMNKREIDNIKSSQKEAQPTQNIDASTNVVNHKTTTFVRPAIRSTEPTFNALLMRNFGH